MSIRTAIIALVITSVTSCTHQEIVKEKQNHFGAITHQRDNATKGAFIVAPFEKEVGLISTTGKVLKTWHLKQPAFNAYLLRNGDLAAITNSDVKEKMSQPFGRFEIRNDQDELVWEYVNPDIHHDFEEMENGDILFTAYSKQRLKVKNLPAKCDRLIQVDREKNIKWEMDLTSIIPWNEITDEWKDNMFTKEGNLALCYVNSVRMKDDKILISIRDLSRVAILDYKEKKLLWMSPKGAFQRQHDAQWLPDGRVIVFNNREFGLQIHQVRPSSIMTIDPQTNKVETLASAKGVPLGWSTAYMGGIQQLSNGNLWVTWSLTGQMVELDKDNNVLQRFVVFPLLINNSNTTIFRSRFYEDKLHPNLISVKPSNACHEEYVSWDGCRAKIQSTANTKQQSVHLTLPPKACEGWEGEAIFSCRDGKWELFKKVKCDWSCPCCY